MTQADDRAASDKARLETDQKLASERNPGRDADARAKLAADEQKAQTAADDKKKADADAKFAKDFPERAKAKKEHEAAQAEAAKLAAAAAEAHAKADNKNKTPEQIAAEEADKKADDARAKAAALHPDAVLLDNSTVAEAKVLLPHGADPNMDAGDHHAQKRANDPSNPKYADGISERDEDKTVRLSRTSRDNPTPIYTMVHPDMVGDYLRAGWGRA